MANSNSWGGSATPVCVVFITLNEEHNLKGALENISGWAQEVVVVDSYSRDDTVGLALSFGARVVQRKFVGFGDQWNFAISQVPISSPWVMKMDPDERLSKELKQEASLWMARGEVDGLGFMRRLWIMGRPLPIRQSVTRIWRNGKCRFTDVSVNEHPIVEGRVVHLKSEMEHHDSPNLDHWFDKQNRYSSAEALSAFRSEPLAFQPRLFGTHDERRMWLKRYFHLFPFRFFVAFLFFLIIKGSWRAGKVGVIWARLRSDVLRFREYKVFEMQVRGVAFTKCVYGVGHPDSRVDQY